MNLKGFATLVVVGFIWIDKACGQANPYGMSEAEGQEMLAIIKQYHLARGSMAYRSAELSRMLGEANYFAQQLNLPTPHPIKFSDIPDCHVTPPWYSGIDRALTNTSIHSIIDRIHAAKITVMGTVQTTNYFFAFNKGYLWNVVRLHDPAMNPENFVSLVGVPSLINDTQAYQLAVKWLASVSIDVPAMEKKHKPNTSQQSFYCPQCPKGTANTVLLPIYYVKWGEDQTPVVKITILGTTKQLMELQIQGEEVSSRPQMLITNAFELCSIPDPPIKHLQRQPEYQTNAPSP